MCSSYWAHFQSSVLLVQLNEHSFWLIFGIACKGYWPPPPILPHLKDSLPPYLTSLPLQNNPHFPVLYPILTFENNEFIVFLKNSSFAIQQCSPSLHTTTYQHFVCESLVPEAFSSFWFSTNRIVTDMTHTMCNIII